MARVLVTGGAGYIGSHAVAQLIDKGYDVFILDNFSTGHRSLVHPKAVLLEGDIRDEKLVSEALQNHQIESVMHFAALTSVEESLRKPDEYYSNNLSGTISLLRACGTAQVRHFIFSSTAAVYAPTDAPLVGENSELAPGTPYGKSKMMSELVLRDFATAGKIRFVILRYFNVAGASQSNEWGQIGDEHTALVKKAALAAVGKIQELPIFGTDYPTPDGTAIRDYIHVEDLAEVHVLALDSLLAGLQSDILNCGYGAGFSVREVIGTMKQVSGTDFPTREFPRRSGDLAAVVADNSKLLKTLPWKPRRNDLELICRTAFEWERKIKSY